jgi:hypothetical protein
MHHKTVYMLLQGTSIESLADIYYKCVNVPLTFRQLLRRNCRAG